MTKRKDVIPQIKRETRRQFSAEENIRIVLEGLRGETAISEICRRESIASSVYYKWSKTFLEASKNGLSRSFPMKYNGISDSTLHSKLILWAE